MAKETRIGTSPEIPDHPASDPKSHSSRDVSSADEKSKATTHQFNEQTHYVPVSTIITIFLAAATVDFLALMDQTTLAASLTIVSNALNAGDEQAWIAGAYFVSVPTVSTTPWDECGELLICLQNIHLLPASLWPTL